MKTRKLQRWLSLLLAVVMMFGNLPMTALAADGETTVSETTEVIETEAPETSVPETEIPETEETSAPETEETEAPETEETSVPETEETQVPETEETVAEETEETVEETTEETVEETMEELLQELEIEALAEMGSKPADGKTSGQPFVSNKPSQYYRIPAMVTLNDGTIVAATDARWNTTGDGGGLDTIVSRSTDGGKNWKYTFANYLGDNGNKWNGGSTAFIDPALATDGETVYMVVDLFPAGYALNSADKAPVAGENGFDANGNLRLSKNGRQSYDYYLEDGMIYDKNGIAQNVEVDAYFNYKVGSTDTNLFFSNSAYQVYPTAYLYLTKSTDGGATWSEPTLINAKKANEQVYIVGPGRGLVTSDGTIIFPCYEYTKGTQNASFIYSNDNGKTWHRTADALANSVRYGRGDQYVGFSSEAQAVELADGTIRMFFRHGYANVHYVDAAPNADGTYTWGKFASGPAMYGNCQLSVIKYSQLIDGKEAVLVSCPTNANAGNNGTGRQAGKIYVGLDNGDGTMAWDYTLSVNNVGDAYSYSCLTELSDGSVALLYENGNGSEKFVTYGIDEIAKGAVIGGEPVEPPVEDKEISDEATGIKITAPGLKAVAAQAVETARLPEGYTAGKTWSITLNGGEYTGAATVKIPYDPAFDGCNQFTGIVDGTEFSVNLADGYFVCEVPHFSDVTVAGRAAAASMNVELEVDETRSFTMDGLHGTEGTFTTSDGVARYTVAHKNEPGTPGSTTLDKVAMNADGTYTGVISDNNDNYMTVGASGNIGNTTDITKATEFTVVRSGNNYTIQGNGYYLVITGSWGTYNLTAQASAGNWSYNTNNGFSYTVNYATRYITYDNGWTVARNSGNGHLYKQTTTDGTPGEQKTTVTITGLTPGTTTVTVGDTTYNVTVKEKKPEQKIVEVNLLVGQNKTFTDPTGKYEAVGGDRSIVDVKVNHLDPAVRPAEVQAVEAGKQYLIVNGHETALDLAMSQTPAGNHPTLGLKCDKSYQEITGDNADPYLWTFEQAANGKYRIKGADGQYVTFTNGNLYENSGRYIQFDVELTNSGTPMDVVYDEGEQCFGIYSSDVNANYWNNGMYLNSNNKNAVGYYAPSIYWHLYEMRSSETFTTEVTFNGLSVGDTTVTVGNTIYKIHVTDVPSVDTSPIVAGEGQGRGKVITKLNITEGVVFMMKPGKGYEGSKVTWTSADPTIAEVDGNGNVTGVKPGETTVTALVDGMTVEIPVVVHPNGSGHDIDYTGDKHVNVYISEITDTDVFYSLTAIPSGNTMSKNMVSCQEGEVFYLNYPDNYKIAFDFFGRPHGGYALTRMSATNAAGDYMSLHYENSPKESDFFTKSAAAGYNQRDAFGGKGNNDNGIGDNEVAGVIAAARNQGCDGGMGFTRKSDQTDDLDSDLTFRSEKLPEIDKEVVALQRYENGVISGDPVRYEPGMVATIGDEIYFRVTVTKQQYQDLITYTNLRFSDSLKVTLYSDRKPDGTYPKLRELAANEAYYLVDSEFSTLDPVTKVFYVGYRVTESDLDSKITNTVQLDYTYKSKYSSGSFEDSADAEASITATALKPTSIVVDFGLPVDVTYTDAELQNGHYQLVNGTYSGTYGTAVVSGSKITYTPGKVLLAEDTVTIRAKNTKTKKEFDLPFTVHPASNVLYEAENFMKGPKTWNWSGNDLGVQSAANAAPYGYDAAYAGNIGTNGSYTMTLEAGEKTGYLTTGFFGNGFDLIGECGPDTGNVVVMIKDANGNPVKAAFVDTSHVTALSQVPFAHLTWETAQECTATVYGTYRKGVSAKAGARSAARDMGVYEVMADLEAQGFDLNDVEFVYFDNNSPLAQMAGATMMTAAAPKAAAPSDPSTAPGGKITIDGFRVYTETTSEIYKTAGEYGLTYTNVLDAVNDTSFAAYVEAGTEGFWTAGNYEENGGPQNEIYLAYNQGIAFKVKDEAVVQISARAVTGPTAWNSHEVVSNTEMYYTVHAGEIVTIRNTMDNGNLLALGNIKSSGNLVPMTEEDIRKACDMLNAPPEPEVTVVPVYRLYNTYTLEHLLTSDISEYDRLGGLGWIREGVAWYAPEDGDPVYRLYNAYTDGHFYTVSEEEKEACVAAGWIEDGVVSYSASAEDGEPIFRMFNPYEEKNYHHYTASASERDQLAEAGWVYEGVAWYAAKP